MVSLLSAGLLAGLGIGPGAAAATFAILSLADRRLKSSKESNFLPSKSLPFIRGTINQRNCAISRKNNAISK